MARLKNVKKNHFVSTIPKTINEKLVNSYRTKLFLKIKDSFEKKKQSIDKEQIELKEWLDKNRYINSLNPINNYWFSPYIRA